MYRTLEHLTTLTHLDLGEQSDFGLQVPSADSKQPLRYDGSFIIIDIDIDNNPPAVHRWTIVQPVLSQRTPLPAQTSVILSLQQIRMPVIVIYSLITLHGTDAASFSIVSTSGSAANQG